MIEEKSKIDIYDAFSILIKRLEAKFSECKILINPSDQIENTIPRYIISIDHQDGYVFDTAFRLPYNHDTIEKYVERVYGDIISGYKAYNKKRYHLNTGVFPTQFSKETLKEITDLSREVFKGIYDGIEIKDSSYSTGQFDFYIVALANTKSKLHSKSEPLIYISLYEFFTLHLFDQIYSHDDPDEINPEWANAWTDLNINLLNTFKIE